MKNVDFFSNSTFLSQFYFSLLILYVSSNSSSTIKITIPTAYGGYDYTTEGICEEEKSFEVMNTVSRVAPGCNFFLRNGYFVVLLAVFYCTTNVFQLELQRSLELVF